MIFRPTMMNKTWNTLDTVINLFFQQVWQIKRLHPRRSSSKPSATYSSFEIQSPKHVKLASYPYSTRWVWNLTEDYPHHCMRNLPWKRHSTWPCTGWWYIIFSKEALMIIHSGDQGRVKLFCFLRVSLCSRCFFSVRSVYHAILCHSTNHNYLSHNTTQHAMLYLTLEHTGTNV